MPDLVPGQKTWSGSWDKDGYATYTIKYRVNGLPTDGPATIKETPGLPTRGSVWEVDGDSDPSAWCRHDGRATPVLGPDDGPNTQWDVEFTFSNKPDESKKCRDGKFEDPLLEPQQVSGGFAKAKKEITHDRFGRAIRNSAHEVVRGPQMEFDQANDTVKVVQNVAVLDLALVESMKDCVNDSPLWGMPRRKIRLANFSWDKKYHGLCYAYYVRTFEFEINVEGFDRNLMDEGTKVLSGRWDTDKQSDSYGNWILVKIGGKDPNPRNPEHFIKFKDRNGENCRVPLNGRGLPAKIVSGTSKLFVSIQDVNVGNKLTDDDFWIPVGDLQYLLTTPEWDEEIEYYQGDVVILPFIAGGGEFHYYVCTEDNQGHNPKDTPEEWVFLGDDEDTLEDGGDYNSGTNYTKGLYVSDSEHTSVGSIRVEHYREANFLLLGIPTEF